MDTTNTDTILQSTSNRQYPLPDRSWKYFQQWENVLFLHWEMPKDMVSELIPSGLTADAFNGSCWISLVSFSVNQARMRNLPALPYFSNFDEVNLRVYVIKDNIPGIYMLSVEASKLPVALFCRIFLGIPYNDADIEANSRRLTSENESKGYRARIDYKMKAKITEKRALEFWLTERHCLYQNIGEKLYRFDIHHKEWDLHEVKANITRLIYHRGAFSTVGRRPNLLHYCKAIDVLLWSRILINI
jgi:uncharacterized protein YqjF (DUF2071 family)